MQENHSTGQASQPTLSELLEKPPTQQESEELISSQARSACIHMLLTGAEVLLVTSPFFGSVSSELSTKDICPEICLAHKVALHAKE